MVKKLLPADPNVPNSSDISFASDAQIIEWTRKFNIRNFWFDKGVKKHPRSETLRLRLNELRRGECPASWRHVYGVDPEDLPGGNVPANWSSEAKNKIIKVETTDRPEKGETGVSEARVRELVLEEITNLKTKLNDAFKKMDARIEEKAPPLKIVIDNISQATEVTVEGQHEQFSLVLKYVQARDNVLMVGPAGSGKTRLAEAVATNLGLRFGFISCSIGMSEGQLMGRLLPFGTGGKFVYVKSQFVDFYKNGGVFLLDEMDAADSNTMMVLQAALSGDTLAVPNDPEHPFVKRHKDFVCIAAANTYGTGGNRTYVGRNQQDGASLDRFVAARVEVDYDPKLERLIVDQEILEWGSKVREAVKEYQLRRIVSTRALSRFTAQKKVGNGLTMVDFKRSLFMDWTEDDKRKIESKHKGLTK